VFVVQARVAHTSECPLGPGTGPSDHVNSVWFKKYGAPTKHIQ